VHGGVLELGRAVASLDDHFAAGGGQGLAEAQRRGRAATIAEVQRAGLRGRGGGWFPTGIKWQAVASDPCPVRYVVCNAAEGEPATFKDRWLIRRNPYQVIEGLAIAAYAIGAERAFIAIKQVFATEVAILRRALAEMEVAEAAGDVPIEIVTGPDSYLFGEEKAMLEVIEGREPLPRILPAYRVGPFARSGSPNPTVVNNLETLANVPHILRLGAERYRTAGTPQAPGSMVFTLCGDVAAPGVYELPLGTSLDELINGVGGGPPPGRRVKAVFVGASHPILPGDRLDCGLDPEELRAAGSGLGSGGFTVFDDSTCIVEATLVFARFLAQESCAQCPPCKTNSLGISALLERIQVGEGRETDLEQLAERCRSVTAGKRCHLPTGEAALVASALELFRAEFVAHLGSRCPSPRALTLPRIADLDEATGEFTYVVGR
jgi:NADH:ubiquinone oxidoreductase subunit F (NADH-binding)